MPFKFERLALDYIDEIYEIAALLPRSEERNLADQITRAATSVALNIAEGSTGQTNTEQARFLGLAIRSLLETVACQHIMSRRKLVDAERLRHAYTKAETLAAKLHAMRSAIAPQQKWIREETAYYNVWNDELLDKGRTTEAE